MTYKIAQGFNASARLVNLETGQTWPIPDIGPKELIFAFKPTDPFDIEFKPEDFIFEAKFEGTVTFFSNKVRHNIYRRMERCLRKTRLK